MGNYPKCYTQINENRNLGILNDPRVFQVAPKLFRQASKTKGRVSSMNEDERKKSIKELEQLLEEVKELEKIVKLPEIEQGDALDELDELNKLSPEEQLKRLEAEENEDDLDSDELLRKRRLENDDPDALKRNRDVENAKLAAMQQADKDVRYSVLSYLVASTGVSGDSFMKKLGVGD